MEDIRSLGYKILLEYMDIESPWYSKWYIKLIVVLLVFTIIYVKIKPYLHNIVDTVETLRSLLDMVLTFTEKIGKTAVDETAIGTKVVVNKIKEPEPDESHLQSKSGYCFIGEWKGVRSCVKVDKTPCKNQVYSTEEQCVNPQLR